MQYRTNKSEFIFFLIYTVYLISIIAGYTAFDESAICKAAFQYMRYGCYLLAVLKIIKDSYYEKQIYTVIILAALTVLTVLASGNKTFAFYFLIILAAKNINVSKIIKLTCYVQGIALISIIGLSQMGVLPDYIFDPGTRARHGLGFTWTTTGPILYFFFMMGYIYIRQTKLHTLELIIMELINLWLFRQTDARMSFYLSSLMLLYIFVMRYYWQNRGEYIRKNWCLLLAPAVMCCVAMFLHIFYDAGDTKWTELNKLLSGRLLLGYNAYHTYGISLFGTPIKWIGFGHNAVPGVYNYVDCSYMQILLENGIVSLVVIVLLYTYIMYMAIKTKEFYLQTVILFICVFSITEPRMMNLGFNPFPLLAAGLLGIGDRSLLFIRKKSAGNKIRFHMTRVRLKNRH